MSAVFDVAFYPYHSSFGYTIGEGLCKSEAREIVAKRLKSYRNQDYPVITLTSGYEWEICEPEDCFLVPDDCGILTIQERDVYSDEEIGFWEEYELLAS